MISTNENMARGTTTGATTMKELEQLASAYASEQRKLSDAVAALERDLDIVRAQHMKSIRSAVGHARLAKNILRTVLEGAPELFEKPRTREFDGIKIGFRKGSGGVDWDDDAKVCELIRKNFPKMQADLLIKTTVKPIAKALDDLDVADLKKIGCRVESTGDVVVIVSTDSAVEKLVKALLADQPETEVAA